MDSPDFTGGHSTDVPPNRMMEISMHDGYFPLKIVTPPNNDKGQVITFYSYKGGTGRTMALVNVAVLLGEGCSSNGGVLAVDWDLEAPGLHKYFSSRCEQFSNEHNLTPSGLNLYPGVIDLWYRLMDLTSPFPEYSEEPSTEDLNDLETKLNLSDFIIPTDIPGLSYMRAGRFTAEYQSRVNNFPWQQMFAKQPWISGFLTRVFASRFRFTLIDSRTGITDTAGICTTLLPDKLVLVFTPNKQSLDGVVEVGQKVLEYRRDSKDDLRPIGIFPLPSRIDKSEGEEFTTWRKGESGYQKSFEELFRKAYSLDVCNLEMYFDEVQVPHSSWYAYGEKISVIDDTTNNRLSLKRSFITFENILCKFLTPWRFSEEENTNNDSSSKQAWLTLASFSEDKKEAARRLFMRMVLVGTNGESAPRRVRAEVLNDRIVPELITGQVLSKVIADGQLRIEFLQINPDFFYSPLLQKWIADDLPFLLWRQKLADATENWKISRFKNSYLLRGRDLKDARTWYKTRAADLTPEEIRYLDLSIGRLGKVLSKAGISSAVILAAALGVFVFSQSDWAQYQQVIKNPPPLSPLLRDTESSISKSLATVMDDDAISRDDTISQWFSALGRAGRISEGVSTATSLPPPIRSIALSALAKGEGSESSPIWQTATDLADKSAPNDQPRLHALISIDRGKLDQAILAADSIQDINTRNQVYAEIVKMLVQRHQEFEARSIARHFLDSYRGASDTNMIIRGEAIDDPLVALYAQLYITEGGPPSASNIPGDHEVGWGLEDEARYKTSSRDTQELAHLQVALASIRGSLAPSSSTGVLPFKSMPTNLMHQASIYIELIRVSAILGDYETARMYYQQLSNKMMLEQDATSISNVPFVGSLSVIDKSLTLRDVAKSFMSAACVLARPSTACSDGLSDLANEKWSARLISDTEIVHGFLFRAESERSRDDLHAAFALSNSVPDARVRSYLLSRVSVGYSKMHDFARAREIADACSSPEDRIRALASLIMIYRS